MFLRSETHEWAMEVRTALVPVLVTKYGLENPATRLLGPSAMLMQII